MRKAAKAMIIPLTQLTQANHLELVVMIMQGDYVVIMKCLCMCVYNISSGKRPQHSFNVETFLRHIS